MAEFIGRDRKARRAYGFDEIALVPGDVTLNPDEVDIGLRLGNRQFEIPFLASAMDGVVDPRFAIAMGKLGGLAVLNLEGIYTRYDDYQTILKNIAKATPEKATSLVQKLYEEPIKEKLIIKRVKEISKAKVPCAVSTIPQHAERFGKLAVDAGAEIFVVQSTVTTTRHISSSYKVVDFRKLCKSMKVPVILGNCVTYKVALDLMDTGCAGILVGIGPGSACTTRGVLGLGVPQVTSIADCAAAREYYYKKHRRMVTIIADGGMSTGGDICKAIACGADGVMVGSAFARTKEAPGKGFHWGMATPHANLPRGTRIRVGTTGSLEEIMYGPAKLDDGTQNLVGALRTCMGNVGAKTIREMQLVELVIAPAIRTEGKLFQAAQRVGMGK
ncbi:MAG: GuaB3 family IMP dehydrogenase-related protein [Candidatus Omnitrophota bacterium]|nr:GuaB3 family IMP dehydrogenase-related protein [Candidatus Omnitrophota bacterium]